MLRIVSLVTLFLCACLPGNGQPQVLWDSQEPLHLVLSTDFETILKKVKRLDERKDGYLKYESESGLEHVIPVKTEPRGRFRRDPGNCRFPPLSLKFPEKNAGTDFENVTKLKLVTHCRRGEKGKHLVAKEFLCYRFFNVLTDSSFKVRSAYITFVDNYTDDTLDTHFTFFIERTRDLRARLGTRNVENEHFNIKWLNDYQALRLSLFQFMIGNTDWSVYQEHNTKAMKNNVTRLAIPYDFDWSGFVSAPYATPHPKYPIKKVTDRHFVGKKTDAATLESVIAEFNGYRHTFMRLINENEVLDEKSKKRCRAYLDSFYRIINEPKILSNYIKVD